MNAADRAQAEILEELIQHLYDSGELPATSGNFSFRSSEDPQKLFLSESGVDKGQFRAENFISVTAKGENCEPGRKVSDETPLHLMIYRAYNAGCVLHGHPLEALHFADMFPQQTEFTFSGLELIKAFRHNTTHQDRVILPLYSNTQDIDSLATKVASDWPGEHIFGFLIRGHGLTCWGNDIAEAKKHWEAFAYLMQYELGKGL